MTTKTFTFIVGLIFLLVGIMGLILEPRRGLLLGIFAVDTLHNWIHVIIGAAGIIATLTLRSRLYSQALGILYLILGVAGFIPAAVDSHGMLFGVLHVNTADNILHLVVGAVAAYFGFAQQTRSPWKIFTKPLRG
jgi:hypothetical protein